MTADNIAVFGIYASGADAEGGAADLIAAGFPSAEISVLLADVRGRRELAAGSAGAGVGGLLSGALGILTGARAQVIPGMGAIVAAGPLAARMEGVGSAAAFSAALVDWGVPAEEAKSYEGRIQDGGTLLGVRCGSAARAKRARQVLNSSGADEVAVLEDSRAQKAEWALL